MIVERERMLRAARFALHVITVILAVVAAGRAAATGIPLLPASLASAAFLAWYGAGAAYARGRRAPWWLFGLAIIWCGMLLMSAEFLWLSFPLLLLSGHLLSTRFSAVFAVPVIAASVIAPWLHGVEMTFAHIAGPLIGGGFALAVSLGYDALLRDAVEREELIASLLRTQNEMTALQDELALTQRDAGAAKERTRLARDLHDTIAQELSSISLLARAGDPQRLAQIDDLASHSLVELRRIVAALAPAELEDAALVGALRRMLDALAADTGIQTSFRAAEGMPPLSTAVEVTFLRIAQSALANVRQHADAGAVTVDLDHDGDRVRLTISDDGVGFDPASLASRAGSYGLTAMRSRLSELGGELRVDSAPGEGTTLQAEVDA